MSVPDKAYSLFQIGSASTDQSRNEPDSSYAIVQE